jgi:hypothetical protein
MYWTVRSAPRKGEVLSTHYSVSLLQLLQRDISLMAQRFALEGTFFRQQGTRRFVLVTDGITLT